MNDQPPDSPAADIAVTQSLRAGDTPPTEAARPTSPPPSQPTARIPGYEILGVLGKGGMGIVYRARQTALKRTVAVKMVLGNGLDDEWERVRFRGEVEAAAALRHANLLQIYEVGEADGRPFCSMEFAEGGSLAQQLRGEPRSSRESAQLVATLARAMQAAHDAGIVHRDLKPANILLTADGQPKIGDFGLAKRLGDPSGFTQSGTVLGTPSYMAPEQALGRATEAGPAADVYSLGAILYELLTGRPPFRGASLLDTLQQVREQEPIPPSRLVPKVERDIETICLKCLEKSEQRRYASAMELADDLQRFLEHRPIVARRVSRLERTAKWARREPLLAATSALLVLVIAAAFAAVSWQLSVTRLANRKLGIALSNETTAKNNEKKSREDAQKQTALKETELERAEQSLYVSRVSQARREWELRDMGRARQVLLACDRERRGWEWHFLNRQTQRTELEYRNQLDAHRVTFLPGGQHLLTQRDPVATLIENMRPRICVIDRKSGRETLGTAGEVAAASPDGELIAVVEQVDKSPQRRVQLYSAATGEPVRSLAGELATGVGLHFGPRGESVIAVDQSGLVRGWKVESGEQVFEFQSKTKPLRRDFTSLRWAQFCTFSADGSRLLLNSGELLNCVTGEKLHELGDVQNACFSPDGQRVAVTTRTTHIKMFDLPGGKLLFERVAPSRYPFHASKLAFSPDGKRLAACSGGFNAISGALGQVKLWDAQTGVELTELTPGSNAVTSLEFSPDGKLLALGGDNGVVQVRDAQSLEIQLTFFTSQRHGITDFDFSADSTTLACAESQAMGTVLATNATVHLWSVRPSGAQAAEFPDYKNAQRKIPADVTRKEVNRFSSLRFAADGTSVAWNINQTGDQVATCHFVLGSDEPPIPGEVETSPAPQRRFLIIGRSRDARGFTQPGQLVIVDEAGKEALVHDERAWGIWQTEQSGDGQRLAAGLGRALSWYSHPPPGHAVKVWDRATGKEIFSTEGIDSTVGEVAISPDGRRVAFQLRTDEIEVWDVDSRGLLRTLKAASAPQTLQFSPAGNLLAAGAFTGGIQVWNLERDQPPLAMLGHQGACKLLAFTSNQRRLASGGEDLTVRLWDLASGQEVLALPGPGETLLDIQFSPDDRRLAVADQAGRLNVWDSSPLAEPPFPTWPPTLAELDRLIDSGQRDAATYRLRAAGRAREVDLSGAAEDLAAAAALDKDAESWRVAIEAAQKAYRYDLVVSACKALIELNDRVADYWLWRGEALARQLNFKEAAADYAQGERLIGNNLEFKTAAAGLYLLAGDEAEYRRRYQQAKQQAIDSGWIGPRHGNATRNAYLLARIACYESKLPDTADQVLAYARQAKQGQPGAPWHLHVLALVQLRAGKPAEALDSLRAVQAADSTWCPDLNQLSLALAMNEADQTDAARALARTTLDELRSTLDAPDSPIIRTWHLHDFIDLLLRQKEAEALASR